jgi:PAS domain S-box-containing protein
MSSLERRILIVDDNPAIHADFRKILCPDQNISQEFEESEAALFGESVTKQTENSFELAFASQGQEALELVRRASKDGRPYMLAFIDVRMPPGWDGIETVARIWELDRDLQVVICTAYSDYSWNQMASKLNQPDKFVILKKPFDTIEVLQLANAFTEKWVLQRLVEDRTRKVQESENRYHFLAEAMPAFVWTARPDGTVEYANERLSEYSGRSFAQNKDWGWQEILHPDDIQNCLKRWTESLQSGNPYQVEYRIRRASDGAYRWHLGRAVPMRSEEGKVLHWVGTSIDIEDQKSAEAALRQAHAQSEERVSIRTAELSRERDVLQALMDNVPDFIYFKDTLSRFTRINLSLSRYLGLDSPLAAIGKTDADFFPGRFARQTFVDEQRLMTTGAPLLDQLEELQTAAGALWISANKVPIRDQHGGITGLVGVSRNVSELKRAEEEIRAQRESFRALTDNAPDAIARIDRNLRFVYVNRVLENALGIPASEFLDKTNIELGLPAQEEWNTAVRRVFETGETTTFEFQVESKDGPRFQEARLTPEHSTLGGVLYVLAIMRDVTERKKAEKERQLMEVQLRQAQKLESIGQLAAGIAHEINTPTQYVGDNTRFLKDSFESIGKVLQTYTELLGAAKSNMVTPQLLDRVEETLAANDLGYLFEQIPAAIKETLEGVERVTTIVRAMKEFSHPGGKEKSAADLNKAIESTVTVAHNEWKYIADLQLDLDPALPTVPCFIGEFNQVILNLIVNASHAIADVVKQQPGTKGTITLRTRCDGDHVEVRVIDTGTGIPESVRPRIFDPFFTTKDVGKGTGQGLSIVYGSIVKKHGGSVRFETEVGKGTAFILRLPVTPRTGDAGSGESKAPTPVNGVSAEPAATAP